MSGSARLAIHGGFAGVAVKSAADVFCSLDHRVTHFDLNPDDPSPFCGLKRRKSRLDSAPVNFSNRFIFCVVALLFSTARCVLAQSTPAQSAAPVVTKLEVETMGSIPFDQRCKLLSSLTPDERDKFSEQFRKLPPGGPSNGKINALFIAWSAVDPMQALESTKKFPTVDTRRVAIEAICFGLKPEAAKSMARPIRELGEDLLPSEEKERLLGLVIVKWSQADPAAAAQFLGEVYPNATTRLAKPGAGDGDLLITTKAVATNWGAAAPQAALDWFQKKQQPENLVAVQSAIIGWWRKDRKAAAAYLRAHVATPNEREIAGIMSGAMAEQDPRVGAQWVEWIKEERLRRRMRLGIAELWASHDPKAAGEWSKGLAGKEGEETIRIVAGAWAVRDSAAAEKWIDSMHGRARDVAIRGFATTISRTNQKLALDWVIKMEDRPARTRLAKAIATEWLKQNPDESKVWIRKSKLSDAEKKQLLESVD